MIPSTIVFPPAATPEVFALVVEPLLLVAGALAMGAVAAVGAALAARLGAKRADDARDATAPRPTPPSHLGDHHAVAA